MTAAWFLISQEGKPLGMYLQERANPAPEEGERIRHGDGWQEAKVLAWEELPRVCAMRRYRVVIRIVR
ncbi:MAG: hypothetical protein HY680_05275 [Chloroflexi bacterium]|nr:hypothetical protein [Chloroflexota bacterium]